MKRVTMIAFLAGAASLMACAAQIPPERLAAIDGELAQPEANELAENFPNHIRDARKHRASGWEELRRGDRARAKLHAWIAWQKLHTAKNLDQIAQARAAGSAEPSPPLIATSTGLAEGAPPDPLATPAVSTTPSATPVGYGVDRARTATRGGGPTPLGEVQEAEDARLRVLAMGLQSDGRWIEAEALLETAQRALDRGASSRAALLARRATLLYEVIRLTRGSFGAASAPATGGPTAAVDRASAGSGRAESFGDAWSRIIEQQSAPGAVACRDLLAEAEALLRRGEKRRDAGDAAEARTYLTAANARMQQCVSVVGERERALDRDIADLKGEARARARAAKGTDKTRLNRLISDADRAVRAGRKDEAKELLEEAVRVPEAVAAATPAAATPTAPRATAPTATAPPAAVAPTAATSPVPTGTLVTVTSPGAAPTAAPTATPAKGTAPGVAVGAAVAAPARTEEVPEKPRARSRIVSSILQPLDNPPE